MKVTGSGAGNDIDLRPGRAAGLGVVDAANNAKFADGIDTGERQQREIGATVHVVSAVDLPIVLFSPVAVDLEAHQVSTNRCGGPRKNLVGVAGIRRARHQEHELRVVAAVEREFAELKARNYSGRSRALRINVQCTRLDGHAFADRTHFERKIDGDPVVDIQNDAGLYCLLESRNLRSDVVTPYRQERDDELAAVVR